VKRPDLTAMKRLHPATRILLLLGLIAMAFAWSKPAWEIRLWAPQYPEGLAMQIWLDNITGDVDVINGLNHYIGMREIEIEAFPEFKLMKGLLIGLIAIGLLPVITGRRPFLWAFVIVLFLAAFAGLGDFWYWSREFGHNLNPKAAISVPGMTYDPPLIGYKAILNFVALSTPAIGGYLLIGCGTLATALLLWEIWRNRKSKSHPAKLAALAPFLLLFAGCESSPQPIDYGKDECAECNMTLVVKHYGNEYITGKGKIFKFDDVNCMIEFIRREPAKSDTKGKLLVIDFNTPNQFIEAERAVYLHHKKLRSPMRGDVAAFQNRSAAEAVMAKLGEGGRILTWEEAQKLF
jgi:copper chaperone NosL